MANVGRQRGRGRRHKFELRVINRTLFTVRAPRYRAHNYLHGDA